MKDYIHYYQQNEKIITDSFRKMDKLLQVIYFSKLKDPIKLLTMQLTLPLVRLCMAEPQILDNSNHPIHRLIQLILEGGQLWSEEQGRGKGSIYLALQDMIYNIHDHMDTNPNILIESLVAFEHLLNDEKQKLHAHISKPQPMLNMESGALTLDNQEILFNESQEKPIESVTLDLSRLDNKGLDVESDSDFDEESGSNEEKFESVLPTQTHAPAVVRPALTLADDYDAKQEQPSSASKSKNTSSATESLIPNSEQEAINDISIKPFQVTHASVLPESRIKQIGEDFEHKCIELTKNIVVGTKIKYCNSDDEIFVCTCREISADHFYRFLTDDGEVVCEMTRNGLAMAIERHNVILLSN